MHSVGNRRRDTGQADFANTAGTYFVDFLIGIIQEVHLNGWSISIHRHNVVGEAGIDWRAVLRVVRGLLKERHSNSHDDRTFNLITAGQWVNNASAVNDGYNPTHT